MIRTRLIAQWPRRICQLGLMALVIAPLFACQRSANFRRDSTYYGNEKMDYDQRFDQGVKTRRLEMHAQPKKRVVVFDFWNDTPIRSASMGTFAADELRRGLHLTGKLIVPEDARSRMGTSDFIQGDNVRTAQLIREGRRLGVAVLVIGRVTKAIFRQQGDEVGLFRQKQSRAAVDVEVKAFDVASGREIAAVGKSGEASNSSMIALDPNDSSGPEAREELTRLAIRQAVEPLISEVVKSVEKMSWQGNIAKVTSSKIYINAGKASGLLAGDILRVMTQGDDVFDPDTGAFIGHSPGEVKGTLEVADFIGTDGSVATVHTGSNFKEGDTVHLY